MAVAIGATAAASGCSLNQEGVSPPANDIFFPSATLVDSTGRWLFVTNSNSDLRYNDGTLVVVDLKKTATDRVRRDWGDCPSIGYVRPSSERNVDFCCWDLLDRQVLNCDSRKYIDAASTVRIGSFAGTMVLQPRCLDAVASGPDALRTACQNPDPNSGRLMVPVRGNTSITVVDTQVDGNPADEAARMTLNCAGEPGDAPRAFAECDDRHRVVEFVPPQSMPLPTPIRLPEEPYALALDPLLQLLYVGHLRGGAISLIDAAWDGETRRKPNLIASFPNIFPADGIGNRGITSLTLRAGDPARTIYASSRYLPRAAGVAPTAVDLSVNLPLSFRNIALIGTGDTFFTNLPGTEFRGIQFLPDAPRAFVLQRSPPALVGFDITPNAEGRMSAIPVDVLETCSSPTFLDMYDAGGSGVRLFVTCYEGGQIYVFDPYVPRLVTVIEVGRGPAGLAFDPPKPGALSIQAYSTGFGANNVSVIDLLPGSPTEYRVVQRLGFPSPVPR